MSTDERLDRLGLLHLRDKPDELRKELERRSAEYAAERESARGATDAPREQTPAPVPARETVDSASAGGLSLQAKDDSATFCVPRWSVSVAGRGADADVVLPSPMVDKKHATFDFRGEVCLVSDAGSSGGTFINGAAVRHPTRLEPGDELRLGGYSLTVRAAVASEDQVAARLDSLLQEYDAVLPTNVANVLSFLYGCLELRKRIESAKVTGAESRERVAQHLLELGQTLESMSRTLFPTVPAAIMEAGEFYNELAAEAARVLRG